MRTLLLDRTTWDFVIDAGKNIAVADNPYSQAQDAASAIKLFEGEQIYDNTIGVPYWTQILGLAPPLSLPISKFEAAARTVPGVAAVKCFISSFRLRKLEGQVQITNDENQTQLASF
jgi:hypothetical protein